MLFGGHLLAVISTN